MNQLCTRNRVHKHEHTEKKIKLILQPSFKHSPLRYQSSFLVFGVMHCMMMIISGKEINGLLNGKITEDYYGFH